jgi:hypothetical protein
VCCAEKNQRDIALATIFPAAYTGTSQGSAVGVKRFALAHVIGRRSVALAVKRRPAL